MSTQRGDLPTSRDGGAHDPRFAERLRAALARREGLLATLAEEPTDCLRLFHGIAEGRPGLSVDRYGPLLLAQTWRDRASEAELAAIRRVLADALELPLVYNHRGEGGWRHGRGYGPWPLPEVPEQPEGLELGLHYDVRPRWRGRDPLLFVDLRAGRRRVREASAGRSVLNLFAYTCGVGLCAAAGGAAEVWNVDFAGSALAIGQANAKRNGLAGDTFRTIKEDVFPIVRQLAGLPVADWRRGRRRRFFLRVERHPFDLVVLDPPAFAKSAYGAVDVVRDYPSLFKPALLATAPGGHVLATNHAAEVSREEWQRILERCATKAGRPLRSLAWIEPEADVPSFDGRPPLKMAWCGV